MVGKAVPSSPDIVSVEMSVQKSLGKDYQLEFKEEEDTKYASVKTQDISVKIDNGD